MKALSIAAALVFVAAHPAGAQGLGYVVAGPAEVSGFFSTGTCVHAAGGGELLVKGVAGGAVEVGVLGNSSSVLSTLTANAVLHVIPTTARGPVSPFVTAGYMRMGNADGSFDGWSVGAGVDIWSHDRVGWRIDIRDHVRPDSRGTVQYVSLRVGIAFR